MSTRKNSHGGRRQDKIMGGLVTAVAGLVGALASTLSNLGPGDSAPAVVPVVVVVVVTVDTDCEASPWLSHITGASPGIPARLVGLADLVVVVLKP